MSTSCASIEGHTEYIRSSIVYQNTCSEMQVRCSAFYAAFFQRTVDCRKNSTLKRVCPSG